MSGGYFNYLYSKLEERAGDLELSLAYYKETMKLLSSISYEMEWGLSGDTCLACANNRIIEGLKTFFDDEAQKSEEAVKIIVNRKQNMCERCTHRD